MWRKFVLIILIALILINHNIFNHDIVSASDFEYTSDVEIYKIYDDNLELLFEREDPVIGDNYMTKDYKFYEIVYLDHDNKTGIAKFIRFVTPPKISKSYLPAPIKVEDRTICMYMTHNDESYLPSDGVDSIYGNGGIKDVALAFKSELEKHMIEVYLDDTLHIPHDTSAYSRSQKTAKSLQNTYSPDALFDIHRDGASRKFYVTDVNGEERGRVRIVIGKANPNMALNEEFATYLMAVGNEMYPWLFTDIYYATGHYNQALDSKAILFEMGSHLVEKELMIDSMTELADVVTTALYQTTVNENTGDLTVNGVENEENIVVNEALDNKEDYKTGSMIASIVIILVSTVCIYVFVIMYNSLRKKRSK